MIGVRKEGYMDKTITLKQSSAKQKERSFHLKDPVSSLTHLIFSIISFIAGIPLVIRAFTHSTLTNGLSMLLFVFGLIGLYAASGIYHGLDISETVNTRLRKIDHCMIFVLIAGTYSPVCLVVLGGTRGWVLFSVIWGLAIAGILLSLLWINCPKWLCSVIYILMGWMCIFAFQSIVAALPAGAFSWLLAGGIIYTAGGVIYALKLPLFSHMGKNFGNHELFHLFCIGGSVCHYVMMLVYVAVL